MRAATLMMGVILGLWPLTGKAQTIFPPDNAVRMAIPPGVGVNEGASLDGVSCGTFVQANAGLPLGKMSTLNWQGSTYYGKSLAYIQWLTGFVTGVNIAWANPHQQISVDPAGIELWMRNYCGSHPTNSLWSAAVELVRETLKDH